MKHTVLILMLAASALAASAQTTAPPTAPAAKSAVAAKPATNPATAAKSSTAKTVTPAAKTAPATPPTVAAFIKDPASIPAVKGIQKPLFTIALRYKDIEVGKGAPAEPGKMLKCFFTLWTKDGVKIDSTDDHRVPQLDKDHKPVVDANGNPVKGDPQPMSVLMGQNRPLPGWDMGFEGMKVGGKRRVYIPWQLGLGARELPARDATHAAVPAKTDLILYLELTDVTDAPPPPQRPAAMPGRRPMPPNGQMMPPRPGTPVAPGSPAQMMTAPKPPAAPAPANAPSTTAPAAPAAPATTGAVPTPPAPPAATTTAPSAPQPK
jgi:peptidylprolyl isomerase